MTSPATIPTAILLRMVAEADRITAEPNGPVVAIGLHRLGVLVEGAARQLPLHYSRVYPFDLLDAMGEDRAVEQVRSAMASFASDIALANAPVHSDAVH